VTVDKEVTAPFIQGMSSGVRVLGRMTLPCVVEAVNKFTFRIILTQGLNRQIRRMCEAWGYEVRRLQRVRIMHIHLGKLPKGKWRHLTDKELSELMNALKKQQPSNKIKKKR
jgi:23S rRNA pseudouridine2604 synthase